MKRNSDSNRIIMMKLPKYSPKMRTNIPFKPKIIIKNNKKNPKEKVTTKSSEFYRNMMPSNNFPRDYDEIDRDQEQIPTEIVSDNSETERSSSVEKSVRGAPVQRSPTVPNVSSNRSTSRRSKTVIRRPLTSLNTNLRTLNNKINNLSRMIKADLKHNNVKSRQAPQQPGHNQQVTYPIPKLTESIIIENGDEFVVFGDTAIGAENLAKILKKSSMRQRVNLIIKELWPSEILEKMYIQDRHKNENHIEITNQQCKKIRDICLYLQQKRELKFIPGSKDDITIYLKSWIGAYLNDHRRHLKNRNTA
ncbi:uncharacterized protein LOC141533469 [Cotesia typhae]